MEHYRQLNKMLSEKKYEEYIENIEKYQQIKKKLFRLNHYLNFSGILNKRKRIYIS